MLSFSKLPNERRGPTYFILRCDLFAWDPSMPWSVNINWLIFVRNAHRQACTEVIRHITDKQTSFLGGRIREKRLLGRVSLRKNVVIACNLLPKRNRHLIATWKFLYRAHTLNMYICGNGGKGLELDCSLYLYLVVRPSLKIKEMVKSSCRWNLLTCNNGLWLPSGCIELVAKGVRYSPLTAYQWLLSHKEEQSSPLRSKSKQSLGFDTTIFASIWTMSEYIFLWM